MQISISNAIGGGGGTQGGGTPTPPPFSNTESILLDGIDDYVDLGASSTAADGGQFSFSFWIKGGSQSRNRYLFSADYYNQNTFWVVSGTSFQWMDVNAVKSNLSIGVLDNNWHHILIIWNPNGANATIRCFTDGANEVNVPTDWRFGTGGIYKGALQYIGNRGGGSYNGFIGNLDEFAIWDDDQSANVSAIYNNAQVHDLNALSSPPINWYRMGDGDTAPTLTDNGSGGNNGTMTNFSTFSTDVPPNPFSNTKSILLDGVDDYVSFSQVTYTDEFTTSFWIKPDALGASFLVGRQANSDYVWLRTVAQIRIRINFSTYIFSEGSGNDINTGAWNHLLISRDSSNNVSLFLNGALFSTSQVGAGNHRLDQIGKVGTNHYDGNVDETAFWDSDQSSNLATIYNSGVPNDISSLSPTLWYRMGDGDTAPTITDNGSSSNNGTMNNFTTFSTDVPT